jgi:LysM repeat protein
MHKVGPDDTLTDIGKRYGVTPASIMAANRLTNPRTEEGDRLMIPAPARPEPTVHAAVRKPAVHRAGTPATTTTRTQRPAAAKATAAVKPAHKPATIVASAAHQ